MPLALSKPLKSLWHRLLQAFGIDPEPLIATLWLGNDNACAAMEATMKRLLPGYRHITVRPSSAATAAGELALATRGHRVGMVAALPQGWRTALRIAPLRTMAFNQHGENWFIDWRDPISSALFLGGLRTDRIKLRPWFWPLAKPRTVAPHQVTTVEGRPPSPLRAPFAVLSPYLPWPLGHGGAVRIYSLLNEASRQFDIHLYAFTEDGHAPDLGPLTQICRSITYVEKPHYREPRWSTHLPPEVHEYNSPAMRQAMHGVRPLQVEYTQLASYPGDILVEHDVTFDLYSQVHRQRPTLASWWKLHRWRRFERSVTRRMLPVVMSSKDHQMLGATNATVIGNGVDLTRFSPTPESPGRRLLFVGSFRHFPNAGAFQWFWREVFPLLKNCQLTVVAGPDPEFHWRQFTGADTLPAHSQLDLRGFVADVKPLYDEANIVVVPTLVSAGTNLKVLEAMAMRRAVVSTPSGIGGIDLHHEQSVLVATEPSGFAQAIHRLLEDAALRTKLAAQAHQVAHQQYSWRSLGEIQARLWHQFSPAPFVIESARSPHSQFASYPAWVGRLHGEVVGHLSWRSVAAGEAEILWIETSAAHRRLGIGQRLLQHALQHAPGTWFLEVRASNTAAQALYTQAGFIANGRRSKYYSAPEEDAILMQRPSPTPAPTGE
jgi:polysaccharide biosynthesis protein PslH